MMPLEKKRITAEVCVHHLHFTSDDYARLGYLIKCNPAIKAPNNREALWKALLDDRLDLIATDHAPHLLNEKGYIRDENGQLKQINTSAADSYSKAHAGLPLVQHSLLLMFHYVQQGRISLERLVEKMCHAVATSFQMIERGYAREGYFADLVILDPGQSTRVSKENIFYKCGWSPLEDFVFPAAVTHTFVNGHLVYGNGRFDESNQGQRLRFNR
jgi:dihydroorotase